MGEFRPLVITDLETTGLDPLINEVIQIGAVRVDPMTLDIHSTFQTKIQPERIELAHPKALQTNGYTPEKWKYTVKKKEAWQSYFAFSRESLFCSWSTNFDWGFTHRAIVHYPPSYGERRDLESFGPFDRHLVDIPSIAFAVLGPTQSLSKDYIANLLGIPSEPLPHDALTGAFHALTIFRALRHYIERRKDAIQAA